MTLPVVYTTHCQYKLSLTLIRVYGTDALSFLQGQSTQAFNTQLQFHAFTDRFGKVLAHFLAYTRESEIEIWCAATSVVAVLDKFKNFVISEDVEWSEPSNHEVFFIFNDYVSLNIPTGSWGGVKINLSLNPVQGVQVLSSSEFNYFCKWQGVPSLLENKYDGEVINQTLLLSYAIDFKKGCFPGQEAIAKIQNLKGAAWAPVIIQKESSIHSFPNQLKINDKVVVEINQDSPEGNMATALALRDVRVHELSIDESFLVKLFPRWPSTNEERCLELYHLGAEQFQKGDEALALESWKLSLEINPRFADSYEAVGVLLGRHEKFQEAEHWMRKLLEVDPDSVMAHTNLSLFLMRQDKIQEAEDHKALATVATFKSFGRQATMKKENDQKIAQKLAELEKRSEMFRQVLEIDPDDSLALNGIGNILMEKNDYESAIPYFLKVLKVEPKYSVAYLSLGKCYSELNQKTQAKEIFTKGIAIAAQKGDLMPANEMQSLLLLIK